MNGVQFFWIATFALLAVKTAAHPQGNMVVFDDCVFWTFVSEESNDHHAEIMRWNKKTAPTPFLTSDFGASDFFLQATKNQLFIIESRYLATKEKHAFRVLKYDATEQITELWPWQESNWNVGSNGFFMPSEEELVYLKYPRLYKITKGQPPQEFRSFEAPIQRIRKLSSGDLLVLMEKKCLLLNAEYERIKIWEDYLQPAISNAPLQRNTVFDMDYKNGDLLLAYWGGRQFKTISKDGQQSVLHQIEPPYTASLVAFDEEELFLFSLSVQPPDPIRPRLWQFKKEAVREIWAGE